jgi:heat shock protein HslJ
VPYGAAMGREPDHDAAAARAVAAVQALVRVPTVSWAEEGAIKPPLPCSPHRATRSPTSTDSICEYDVRPTLTLGHMGIRRGVVLALPLLLLAACGDSGDDGPKITGRTVPDLDGTSWIATKVTEGGKPRALVPGSELRVEFTDGSISINAGCNGMGGDYTLSEESELGTGTLMGTEMACAQPLMDQDAWLSGTVFAEPLTVSVDGNVLTLSREGLELELTDRVVASPDLPLQGTTWTLDGIESGDTASSVPAGTTVPTLTIAEDGVVTLHTGCNGGRGTATVSGSTIAFGPVMTTKMACAEESGRQTEAAVLAVLDGDVEWSITEKSLTLTKGDRALSYRAGS